MKEIRVTKLKFPLKQIFVIGKIEFLPILYIVNVNHNSCYSVVLKVLIL